MDAWSKEQQDKARPRVIEACAGALRAREEGDLDTFWMVAGVIAGGMEKLGYPAQAAAILRACEAEGNLEAATVAIAAARAKLRLDGC